MQAAKPGLGEGHGKPDSTGRARRWAIGFARFMASCALLAVGMMATAGGMAFLAVFVGPGIGPVGNAEVVEHALSASPYQVLMLVLMAGTIEEVAFRIVPLGTFALVSRRYGFSGMPWTATATVLVMVSSALFGYAHGNLQAVFFQGAGGVLLATAFLRRFARSGFWISSLLVVVAHILYDLVVLGAARSLFGLSGATVP